MNSPLISVIIPVYNTQKFLYKCLDSVLNQTFKDIEVICINDGSTDNSYETLKEYAKKDERIIIINQENQGQSVARNKGLNLAIGEYIFFVDSDDYIHIQAFEIMYSVAIKSKCSIVATEKIVQLSNLKSRHNKNYNLDNITYKIQKEPLKHLLNNTSSSSVIWNKLYKKEVLNNWRFIEGIYFEDWPFITCLFSEIPKYATIPFPINFYNNTNHSTVRSSFTIKKINDYITGIRFVHQYYQAEDKHKYAKQVCKKRIVISIKMMINKTRKESLNRKELTLKLKEELHKLHKEKIFYYRYLSIKILFRFLVMHFK